MNIILISRNKQELENVANEIRDVHKVDTNTIVADFVDTDNIGKIVKKVKALNHEIGVVVNNVGMMGPGYNNMADMEKKAVKVETKVYLIYGFSKDTFKVCNVWHYQTKLFYQDR